MRCVAVFAVACVAAGLVFIGLARTSAEPVEGGERVPDMLWFSGIDLWRNGGFVHGGFLYAYQGARVDGPVFKMLLNGGMYRYRSGRQEFAGHQAMAAALPGWRFVRDTLEVTVFAGLDVQNHRVYPDDPANRLRGTHTGVRAGFDVWYEPLRDVMLAGSVSASTVGHSYWTRGAAGVRLFDSIWVGPEVIAGGDSTYRQFRAGAHLTSLRLGAYEFSLGAGYVTDSDTRDGIYGRLGLLFRPFTPVPAEKPAPF